MIEQRSRRLESWVRNTPTGDEPYHRRPLGYWSFAYQFLVYSWC